MRCKPENIRNPELPEKIKKTRRYFMSVAVIMGSMSDLDIVQGTFDTLEEFGIPFEARVLSAHRTPDEALSILS